MPNWIYIKFSFQWFDVNSYRRSPDQCSSFVQMIELNLSDKQINLDYDTAAELEIEHVLVCLSISIIFLMFRVFVTYTRTATVTIQYSFTLSKQYLNVNKLSEVNSRRYRHRWIYSLYNLRIWQMRKVILFSSVSVRFRVYDRHLLFIGCCDNLIPV